MQARLDALNGQPEQLDGERTRQLLRGNFSLPEICGEAFEGLNFLGKVFASTSSLEGARHPENPLQPSPDHKGSPAQVGS